jgi:hypothetical protein
MESTESWWDSLHDADLVSFSTDIMERTATLEVLIEHLGNSESGAAFTIVFKVVRAVNMAEWQLWTLPNQELTDPDLMGKRDWGRMVSIDCRPLAGPGLRINNATVSHAQSGNNAWPEVVCDPGIPLWMCMLDIAGTSADAGATSLAIVFEQIEMMRDAKPITVEAFVKLGEAYWERWQAGAGNR